MATIQQIEEQLSELAKVQDKVTIVTPIDILTTASDGLQPAFHTFFIADRAYVIDEIREAHQTAQTTADGSSLQITKCANTVVPGQSEINIIYSAAYVGTDYTYRGINQKYDGNTFQTYKVSDGSMTNKASSITLAEGDRLVWGCNGTLASTFITLSTTLIKV